MYNNKTQIAYVGDTIVTNDNSDKLHFWDAGVEAKVSAVRQRPDGVFEYSCRIVGGSLQILIGSEIAAVTSAGN